MPTLVDKPATVELLRHEFAALGDLCGSFSAGQWEVATCLPGWTVRDVLSHIIGTESMLCGDPTPTADISHLDHMKNPIAEGNEVWVESMRSLGADEMRARLADVAGRRLEALDAMSQADFDAPSWTPAGRDETYGRFMRIRHYDCFLHELDIRYALGLPPRMEVDDLRSATDEVATGLGYIVGRRAAMPAGSRVRFDLTGPLPRTYLVQVDERAGLVDSFDQPATVGLELPLVLFLRLTGGRDDGTDPAEEIEVSGDHRLAEQLIANLAFTI